MEPDQNGGSSEHPSCSYVLTVTRILGEQREHMVLKTCSQVSKMARRGVPVTDDLIRRMVIEGFQPDEERLWCEGTRNEFREERNLQLKFLDNKVADTVTGKELKGLKDECLMLALLDSNEHTVVTCGPGSSAKVDILLLEDNGDGDESNMTREKFERSIIQTGDKKKPHISPKSGDIFLKNGVADLKGIKLGHNQDWIRLCSCRLGARIGQNLEGTTVHEAWTAPFEVRDKRHKQYGKLPCPYLTSEVWRLKGIDRTGKRRHRLKKKYIETVQDFLFWLHVNPEELQNTILGVGDDIWKTIVSHAQSCKIDCEKMFCYRSSTEPQRCVIYDCVGKLKGEMIESQFVRIDNLSADRKDDALKLLRSVLERASALYHDEKEFLYTNTSTICDHVPSDPLGSREMGEADTEKLSASGFQNHNSLYSDITEVGGSSSSIHVFDSMTDWFGDQGGVHDFGPSQTGSTGSLFDGINDEYMHRIFGIEHGQMEDCTAGDAVRKEWGILLIVLKFRKRVVLDVSQVRKKQRVG